MVDLVERERHFALLEEDENVLEEALHVHPPLLPTPVALRKRNFVFLLLPSAALGTLAVLLLAPVFPQIKIDWFNNDFKHAQQISGIMTSLRLLLACLVSPIFGRYSDRYGRVPFIRINNAGSLLPILVLYLTNGESALAYYSTFVFCGILTSGQFFLPVAYLADCTVAADRPFMFGSLGAMQGLCFVLSPFLVSTVLNGWTNVALFKLSICLLGINALWIELFLPESLEFNANTTTPTSSGANPSKKEVVWTEKQSHLLYWLSFFVLFTVLPETGVGEIAFIYLNDVLQVESSEMRLFTSRYLTLTGIGLVLSQTLYLKLFSMRNGNQSRLLIVSTVANVLHMLVYVSLASNHSIAVAYGNIFVTSFMFVGMTAMNALVSKHTNEADQGVMLGTLDSIRSFVGAIGPVLFSFLYSYFGDHFDYPHAPFVFGAVFTSLALFIVLFRLANF